MKEIYKGVIDVLVNDQDLRKMVSYTDQNKTIRRAYSPVGKWDKLVIFYLQPANPMSDFSPQIRTVPLIVRVYDRNDDLNVEDVSERIVLLLDGSDLDVSGKVFVYNCSYTGDLIPTSWNDEQKSYEKVLRFQLSVRVDAIAGDSETAPTRKRK
jgi:hypothetical protein